MAWPDLQGYVSRVRRGLTSPEPSLPASWGALNTLLGDLITRAQGRGAEDGPDVRSFFLAYAGRRAGGAGNVRAGVEQFAGHLAECLVRMAAMGRLRDARVDSPAFPSYDSFVGALRLNRWLDAARLRAIFEETQTRVVPARPQERIRELERPWVERWQRYFRSEPGASMNGVHLARFVLDNWDDFKGRDSTLGAHATALGWGVGVGPDSAWYATLDAVDPRLSDAQRQEALAAAVAEGGFWEDLYRRQYRRPDGQGAFYRLCETAYQVQTIERAPRVGLGGGGSRAMEELTEEHWRDQTEAARTFLGNNLPHWRALRNSLPPVDRDRLDAIGQCYEQYWSRGQEVPAGSDIFLRAGLRSDRWLGMAGDQSAVLPGTPPPSGCSCSAPGPTGSTVPRLLRILLPGIGR
jgi:hypothetical protein